MTPLVTYTIEMTSCMAAFYIFYLAFLNRDTSYYRNRLYLIGTLLASVLVPMVKFTLPEGSGLVTISQGFNSVVNAGQVTVLDGNSAGWIIPPATLLLLIYVSGVLFSAIFLGINMINLSRLIKKYRMDGSRLIMTEDDSISGFSAMGYIFINSKMDEDAILKVAEHEMKHLDHHHFTDLLFVKLLSVIFWFNPVIYLYERSLKAVHEFQVDEYMIGKGENILNYQRLILNQLFSTRIFSIQNAFSGSTLIKKRMIMMTKKRSGKLAGLKLLLIIPVAGFLILAFSCQGEKVRALETIEEIKEVDAAKAEEPNVGKELNLVSEKTVTDPLEAAMTVVEEMPTFQGGDIVKFRSWVQSNVKYPPEAARNGEQGKVFVMFLVNEDGTVSDVNILRGVSPALDQEAFRVVSQSPLWEPGVHKGKTVPVKFSITVNYALQ